jgi:hypothetical protein
MFGSGAVPGISSLGDAATWIQETRMIARAADPV